jgi:hypothetical protein
MVFTHAHIALTAAMTGLISAGIGFWRLDKRRRLLNGLGRRRGRRRQLYLWRASANMPLITPTACQGSRPTTGWHE